jgi:hypothetical protein
MGLPKAFKTHLAELMEKWKFLTVCDAGSAKTGSVSSSKLTFGDQH